MSRTSGSTSSPIPISPFSPSPFSANSDSHYTSDDQPDLGAFRTVLREWVHLQPPPRIPVWAPSSTTVSHTQTQTHTTTGADTEGQQSTVWNQRPIADYLQVSLSSVSRVDDSDSGSDIESVDEVDTDTDTEGARTVEIETEDGGGSYTPSPLRTQQSLDDDSQSLPVDGIDDRDEHVFAVDDRSVSIASTLSSLPLQLRRLSLTPPRPDISESSRSERSFYESARSSSPPQSQLLAEAESTSSLEDTHTPSLGYLDEALSFIAAERARWTAQREAGEWRHVIEPSSSDGEHRRKRRKKRALLLGQSAASISSDEALSIERSTAAISIASDSYSDEEAWARATAGLSKSTPTTPRARSRVRPARPTIVTAMVTATPSSTPYSRDARPHGPSPQKSKTKKARKLKLRSKPVLDPTPIQILTHSRSTPALRNLAMEEETSASADAPTDPPRPRLRLRSRSKPPPGVQLPPLFSPVGLGEATASPIRSGDAERGRLVRLTRELEALFPDEREVLRGVEGRLAGAVGVERGDVEGAGERSTSTRVGGAKGNKRKRGKMDDGEASGDRAGGVVVEGGTDRLDPRGREVREGDPLVHVFIDHSNILIGLLNHLRRHPPNKASPAQPNTSPTRHRKTLSFRQPQAHIEDVVDGGKDIETLVLGRKPKSPKPKPPNAEVEKNEDTTEKVAETGGGENGDSREESTSKDSLGEVGEVRSGDRGTRMRVVKKEGPGEEGGREAIGRVSRPLPPIPISAPGAMKSTATPSSSTPSSSVPSSHATPIPLPSFATAGKMTPKAGGNSVSASSTMALKLFGIQGASPAFTPASTVHLPMGSTTTATTSTGTLSQDVSAASTTDTTNTTPLSSPRKLRHTQGRKSTAIALSTSKRISKSANTVSIGDPGGKADGDVKNSKGGVESSGGSSREGNEASDPKRDQTKKRPVRHLSHTALALILERGRPINRRILVTSSPLYQPMDTIERLGYEVRVYLRVPDLGDGMDRERHRNSSGHRRRHSGGTSSTATASSGGSPKKKAKEHVRRVSGTTNMEIMGTSASAGEPGSKGPAISSPFTFPISDLSPTSVPDARHHHNYHLYERHALGHPLHSLFPHHEHTQHHQHPLRPSLHVTSPGAGAGNSASPRVRYREQGVDELLQLKLHQALAAVDDVPEGATIVLATGDGNVGQFNEDGFLGPIRTALKRGWKVELYAWEDGLSRSWKREFGEGSEWGQSGMFRVIGMEQFAQCLVEEG